MKAPHSESDFDAHYPPFPQRVHEACGAGAMVFAFALCALQTTNVIWIYRGQGAKLYPSWLVDLHVFARMQFLHIANEKTQLWCMEEALRSGAVKLVVCERSAAVNFRDMRRLQLAAESGRTTGLFLIPERFASPAAETRWLCAPIYDEQDINVTSTLQSWSLIKNKKGALGQWKVNWDDKTHRFVVV